jgi:hypothetical protein
MTKLLMLNPDPVVLDLNALNNGMFECLVVDHTTYATISLAGTVTPVHYANVAAALAAIEVIKGLINNIDATDL